MPTEEVTVKTKNIIPLWLAVAITVCRIPAVRHLA